MSNFNVIFVAGVHGVGKSHFCSEITKDFSLPTYSASELIKSIKKSETDINKQVIDSENNQDALLLALKSLQPQGSNILLDGHFCLLQNEKIINISESVFMQMNPKFIIVLYDEPKLIFERTKKRGSQCYSSIELLKELQKQEIDRANYIATTMKVNIHLLEQSKLKDKMNIENIFLQLCSNEKN